MRRAVVPLVCLMLGSGCAGHGSGAAPVEYTLRRAAAECPRPAPLTATDVPLIDGEVPLDAPRNVDALLARHIRIKAHVAELGAALDCYEAQSREGQR